MKLRKSIEEKVKKFDQAIREASPKVGMKLVRDKKRWLCRNDLFYLCCLTGNTKIEGWKSFYQPFCDEVSLMNWKVVHSGMHPPSEGMLTLEEAVDGISEISMERL